MCLSCREALGDSYSGRFEAAKYETLNELLERQLSLSQRFEGSETNQGVHVCLHAKRVSIKRSKTM